MDLIQTRKGDYAASASSASAGILDVLRHLAYSRFGTGLSTQPAGVNRHFCGLKFFVDSSYIILAVPLNPKTDFPEGPMTCNTSNTHNGVAREKSARRNMFPTLSRTIATIVLMVIMTGNAFSWSNPGHMAVALVAYKQLDPGVRDRVDALIAM